jgi:hypothetical protein
MVKVKVKVKVKVNLSLCLTKNYAMKTYWGSGGIAPRILDLSHFIPRERAPGTHWIGGWVDPRAVLDAVAKMDRTQSMHRKDDKYI